MSVTVIWWISFINLYEENAPPMPGLDGVTSTGSFFIHCSLAGQHSIIFTSAIQHHLVPVRL